MNATRWLFRVVSWPNLAMKRLCRSFVGRKSQSPNFLVTFPPLAPIICLTWVHWAKPMNSLAVCPASATNPDGRSRLILALSRAGKYADGTPKWRLRFQGVHPRTGERLSVSKYVRAETRREAQALHDIFMGRVREELRKEAQLVRGRIPKTFTVGDAVRRFVREAERWERVAPATLHAYREWPRYYIIPYIGDRLVRELTRDHLQDWIYQLVERPLAPSTIRGVKTVALPGPPPGRPAGQPKFTEGPPGPTNRAPGTGGAPHLSRGHQGQPLRGVFSSASHGPLPWRGGGFALE